MDYKTLLWERFDSVLRITTNRPHVLNAQSRVLLMELDQAFARAAEDPDIRVIIIAGAGQHFSAGHDLGSPEEMEDARTHPWGDSYADELRRLSQLFLETTLRWRDVPKPTIAQVQGYCIMGGLMLASCCDLIMAAEDALFADRAVRWGGSHVQYFSMPWDLGPRKTKEYLFTGEFFNAERALAMGLVNHVVPRAELESRTLDLARRIAGNDPFALKMAKRSVNDTLDIQGQRQAIEIAFKNYMMTIPTRIEKGTYGAAARARDPKDRFAVLNRKPAAE